MTDTRHVIENNLDLYQAVGRLPDRLRLTVVMWAYGYSQAEIGRRMGITRQSVGERLENAFCMLNYLTNDVLMAQDR